MVETGLDVFLGTRGGQWRGKRLGAILHQASVTRGLRPALEALTRVPGLRLTALFAPEHGLAGTLQDQIPVRETRDPFTGLTVHSLYGPRLSPVETALQDVDVLLFDLQDIGVRYYTFIWTLALAMRAAAKAGIPLVVLDRPNPLGGVLMEGNVLDPAFASFVGLHPLPVRHGMTCGELALYFNRTFGLNCDARVVRMRGWRRAFWHDRTGLPWVPPSPNMPAPDTAAVYAGTCLVEGTNLSEGRGTTRPFETVGAPFVNPHVLARELNARRLPGVVFRPCSFQPTFHKWSGESCHGVYIHVTDRLRFRPYFTGLVLLQTVRRLHPRDFAWRKPPYEYETRKMPIDILCGTDAVRHAIEDGADLGKLAAGWEPALRSFRKARAPFLLYR